ncbi:MAG: CBS domain-containing protein [Opitutales bacterium]|nr:CBS domain-containing protein [Opitutales bacterium]
MYLRNISISSILNEKSSSVYYVDASATVAEAVGLMNSEKIGSVMVIKNGQYVGIFTERDVLNRVISAKLNPERTRVEKVMTSDFISVQEKSTLRETMQIMTNKRVRHLPVFKEEKLVGMISIGDVTRKLLEINQNEAASLRQYLFTEYSG